jgi:hypothetical protein
MTGIAYRVARAMAVLAAVGLAGCGGSKNAAEQQISQTLHSYLKAQANGDGTAACALLAPAGQQQLITLVVQNSKGLITTPPSCADAVSLIRAVAGQQIISALPSASIENVHISGNTATADVVVASQASQQVKLIKVGDSWKIVAVPGLG